MITIKSNTPYLSIPFRDVLNVDSIQNLKEGIRMMGMCFKGKPMKAQIVKMYDQYVKDNPVDVLRCLRPEEQTHINNILKQGKGGHVTVKGLELYNQLQKMNLVVSREDEKSNTTDLYLLDELHTLFAPHIDDVINNPIDYSTEKSRKTPLDSTLYEVLNSKELKNTIERIKQDRLDAMAEAERAEREDGPFKYLPAFTKHPAKYPPMKESYCATRLVRPRIYEITLPLENDLYFVVYFHYLEQNGYTQATCYWGKVFDFAQKAASEPYPGAGYVMLSKPFRKKYPHVASVYGMNEDNQDCTKPYLTTIGWDGQPKEWFLSVRLWDFDYASLITLGPLDSEEALDAIDALRDASLAMMQDIKRSDAKQPKLLMQELFGI